MKIVHVTEAWVGGISSIVKTLIRRQVAAGHSVTLVYARGKVGSGFERALFEAMGVRCIAYESSRNPFRILVCAQHIRAILRDIAPDIVHLHSSFAGFYGRILKPEFACVYCAHGWSFVEEGGAVKRFLYRAVERFLARRCAAILNVSEREQRAAIAAGIEPSRMRVVLNGVEDIRENLAEIDFQVDRKVFNLGYIGRLDPKKGFDLLYDHFKTQKPLHVHLSVIGGAARSRARYFNDEALGITFLGWVEADLIDSYMQHFDAIVVPSRHEAFGLVVLEAMRNGVPAIVARDTAMVEMVRHGYNGYVFDIRRFKEEMDTILAGLDKIKLAEMGRNARQTYESRFTAKRMADEVLAVYTNVLTAEERR